MIHNQNNTISLAIIYQQLEQDPKYKPNSQRPTPKQMEQRINQGEWFVNGTDQGLEVYVTYDGWVCCRDGEKMTIFRLREQMDYRYTSTDEKHSTLITMDDESVSWPFLLWLIAQDRFEHNQDSKEGIGFTKQSNEIDFDGLTEITHLKPVTSPEPQIKKRKDQRKNEGLLNILVAENTQDLFDLGNSEGPIREIIKKILQALPEKQYDDLQMYVEAQMTHKEIAEKRGVSQATVQESLSACKKKLEQALSGYHYLKD